MQKKITAASEAWPLCFTTQHNKKYEIYLINPGEVKNRQLTPSKAVHLSLSQSGSDYVLSSSPQSVAENSSPIFMPEEQTCYHAKRVQRRIRSTQF